MTPCSSPLPPFTWVLNTYPNGKVIKVTLSWVTTNIGVVTTFQHNEMGPYTH